MRPYSQRQAIPVLAAPVDPRRLAAASARYHAIRLAAIVAQRGDLQRARAIVARTQPGAPIVIEINTTTPGRP